MVTTYEDILRQLEAQDRIYDALEQIIIDFVSRVLDAMGFPPEQVTTSPPIRHRDTVSLPVMFSASGREATVQFLIQQTSFGIEYSIGNVEGGIEGSIGDAGLRTDMAAEGFAHSASRAIATALLNA